jgi:hypothetical protein
VGLRGLGKEVGKAGFQGPFMFDVLGAECFQRGVIVLERAVAGLEVR